MKLLRTAVAALALASCAKPPVTLHGTVIDPPRAAASLDLTEDTGDQFSLDAVRGVPAAIFFGYTRCKDVCPQTLVLLQRARDRAGLRTHGANILFVSVDPAHDNPRTMHAYLERIGVHAIGLTGTQAQVAKAERDYGVSVIMSSHDIVHGNYIYMLDRAGRLRELLHPDSPVADIADDFRKLAH